jgi:protein-arginine kinase
MASYITQSQAKDKKDIDPDFDLIMNDDLAQNQWPKALDEIKKGAKMPLMAQVMTPELFEKYKNIKTEKAGWTIARAINTGVCYPSSFVGCHAGDLESYSVFGELFRPVIEKYHIGYKLDGSMKHVTDMDPAKIPVELADTARSKIISTRIRCARNLAKFPLNPASSEDTRLQVAALMEKVFAAISSSSDPEEADLGGTFYRHTTMTPEETKQLVDDHFLFRGRDKMQAASGYHQFWPVGRGIFCSKDKKFLLWVNEGDHLRIISMEQGGDVKSVFSRLHRGAKAIEKYLKQETGDDKVFMSDPILGMITCCPTNIGTGMRGSVHILVPKLIKSIGFEKIDEIARTMNCQARGSTGEHSEVIDRIDISNWRRLGFPEYELVSDMISCVNKLAQMEDEVKE